MLKSFLLSIKKRYFGLFFLLFFSLVIIICAYNSYQMHIAKDEEKLGIEESAANRELYDKCDDIATDIKEIKKAYKKHKKISESYHKATILSEKKSFEDFKKTKKLRRFI